MTGAHFLRDDFISTLLASALFALFAVPPGYVLGWLTGLLNFRRQTLAWRFAISVPVSISAVPVLTYWLDKLGGPMVVWVTFAVCWIVFAGLVAADAHPQSRIPIAFVLLAVLWAAAAFGSLVDLPLGGDRLYASVTSWDQTYRTSVTDAITRTGFAHPVNPLGYVDGPAPLRYHYFWFILSSLVDQAGGVWVGARHAFFASVIWCGIGLACVIGAYLRFFVSHGESISSAWILKGLLLLAVTGLDVIPTFNLAYFRHVQYMDMEAWNEPVTSWLGSLLWVPHAVGALVAGVTGFLVLFHAPSLDPRQRWMTAAVAGVLLATMLGDSIYVGLVMAVFLSVWTLITFFLGWRSHTALLVLAGLITVILALPYLISLTGQAGGGAFLHLTVRDFRGARAFGIPTEFPRAWETYWVRLALLPFNYLLELGFFLIAGILYLCRLWHLRRFGPRQVASITMVFTSVLMCSFFKSGVITNNDLGWRGFLPAQFMLLIWAVELLRSREEKWTGASRMYAVLAPTLPVLLMIGAVSTVYSAITLRVAEILNDQDNEHPIGKKNFAARRIYEQLRDILPVTAVVQQNPAQENPVYWGIYANRQTAVGGRSCGIEFGGTGRGCDQLYPALAAIFESGAAADQVDPLCRRLKIDVLVVTSGDPVWSVRDSWVWERNPLISVGDARAFLITSSSVVRTAQ
ncbi:MAG: hypothetical protein JWO19_1159 [Bryobacterales bacterium]|nr:hypothetical protein [Bryobacterales bacterium]